MYKNIHKLKYSIKCLNTTSLNAKKKKKSTHPKTRNITTDITYLLVYGFIRQTLFNIMVELRQHIYLYYLCNIQLYIIYIHIISRG